MKMLNLYFKDAMHVFGKEFIIVMFEMYLYVLEYIVNLSNYGYLER